MYADSVASGSASLAGRHYKCFINCHFRRVEKLEFVPDGFNWARALLTIVIVGSAATGCGSATDTLWSATVPSPDRIWTAQAIMENTSGPGNNFTAISVYLKRKNEAGRGKQVLLYSQSSIPWRENTPPLLMTWLAPRHLQVTFNQLPNFDAKITNYAGIDISVGKGSISTR